MLKGRPIEILLAEDSPSDQVLTRRALEDAKVLNHLHIVEDGVEVMAFLRKEGKYAHAGPVDLILLDLNMPRKDGREVLAEIKQHEAWKRIPVVVLTTSQDEKDVFESYNLHANCYITKPVDFEQFTRVIKAIQNFWFSIVTLPTE